ncbi:phosphoserine aminotransferase [Methylohalomonas lacus]|uniref:Phosphoserine aminotransferase n=1 Tax=Methylohalomonas lacus TaxID=398773 RepID=A0AAE3HJD2_9GAMM|nr:phosphoserine aminotransferase [Methylohalomonas lacus]
MNSVLKEVTNEARTNGPGPGRAWNFSAGPAMLPQAVMEQAQAELLDWQGTGISVLEMGHRTPEFLQIAQQAEADLRHLLDISDDYHVLFLQGGGTGQFGMVPLNLLGDSGKSADYLITGHWSQLAHKEAVRIARARVAADGATTNYCKIPDRADWQLDPDAAYVYYCANETLLGVEFHDTPDTGDVPLVADMTSNLLARPLDVSRFGVVFAGMQKNIGPTGMAVVIVRKDLAGNARSNMPSLEDYALQAKAGSMLNTPPTFTWYMAGLNFRWLLDNGGLEAMAAANRRKADKLYRFIDASSLYYNEIDPACRSDMNVHFRLRDESLQQGVLEAAGAAGLKALAGHRVTGGLRASLYNAMPEAGVDALIDFLGEFERRHG